MKLIAYVADGYDLDIRPARAERAWMDNYVEQYAYGCLPMVMANMHGWEVLSPVSFTAVWNGGAHRESLAIIEDEDSRGQVLSHFGSGIITFRLPAVFRTEPGYDLYIHGPPNFPVDGVTPLSAIVEVDWASTRVTMNWQMTQPGKAVRFRKGEAFCQIFPIRRAEIEAFEPVKRSLSEDPELSSYMQEWSALRAKFNEALKDPESEERRKKWPGTYRRGADQFGKKTAPESHRTRLRLKPFDDIRPKAESEE
jgi:uncharacterized protein DUF6065